MQPLIERATTMFLRTSQHPESKLHALNSFTWTLFAEREPELGQLIAEQTLNGKMGASRVNQAWLDDRRGRFEEVAWLPLPRSPGSFRKTEARPGIDEAALAARWIKTSALLPEIGKFVLGFDGKVGGCEIMRRRRADRDRWLTIKSTRRVKGSLMVVLKKLVRTPPAAWVVKWDFPGFVGWKDAPIFWMELPPWPAESKARARKLNRAYWRNPDRDHEY